MTSELSIHELVENGDLRAVLRRLLANPASIDTRKMMSGQRKEWLPIHVAAANGDTEIAAMLLRFGADVNSRAGELIEKEDDWEEWDCGTTPLMLAAWHRHTDVVSLFLDNDADLELGDRYGFTPLHAAVNAKGIGIARLLLEKGASVHATYSRHTHDLELDTEYSLASLHLAARNGNAEICKLLLKFGADPDLPDFLGQVPLHYAARRSNSQVVELLLDAGAMTTPCRRPAGEDPFDGEAGFTPLHYAAEGPLDSGGAPHRSQFEGATIELLCKASEDIDAVTEHGETALHLAVDGGWIETVSILLGHGANPNAQSNFGETPLHRAVRASDEFYSSNTRAGVSALLLAYGADSLLCEDDGQTALALAQRAANQSVADLILRFLGKRGVK